MSRSSKLSLVHAFGAVIAAHYKADEDFTALAGPVLVSLMDQFEDEELVAEWRKLNIAAYKAHKVTPGHTMYRFLATRSSMLFNIARRNEEALTSLVHKYTSLQGVYLALSPSKKAATTEPKSFREKLVRFLAGATTGQRTMVRKNIRSILAEAAQ